MTKIKAPLLTTKIKATLTNLPASVGLEYELNEDNKSYSVIGIGTCTELEIVIPNTYNGLPVTSIGYTAFLECNTIASVTIHDSITDIGYAAFAGCKNLNKITVDKNNSSYKSVGGNLYTKDGTNFIQYAIAKDDTSFTIPNDVTSISGCAFAFCDNLTSNHHITQTNPFSNRLFKEDQNDRISW